MSNPVRSLLVLDASVLINFAATSVMARILSCLPEGAVVVDHAYGEV